MKRGCNVKIMNKNLINYLNNNNNKPELFTKNTLKFWDDEHISKGMLEAHLNPDWDAATRKHEFITRSVEWITELAAPGKYPDLLDLGCGPGLYDEKFYKKGYHVTGVDFSQRSVKYAKTVAADNNSKIIYLYQDYLTITYREEFDLVTLIYCDYGVLSQEDRNRLLNNIYRALRPGGKLVVDVFTPKVYQGREESKSWSFQKSGFWCDKPHLCLNAFYRYDESNTMLEQAVIITEDNIKSYYIWDHTFTPEELRRELADGGFNKIEYFNDVAGTPFTSDTEVICAVATK